MLTKKASLVPCIVSLGKGPLNHPLLYDGLDHLVKRIVH